MTTVLPAPASVLPLTARSAPHPTPCPTWCRETHSAASAAPLLATAHQSAQHRVANPDPLPGYAEHMLRAQLTRIDRRGETGVPVLYVAGDGDVELPADEADSFIAQAQAFVDILRVLRRQMD
ncbi:MAG: DUF6907 domain-containing protein [Pseudonocardia sp.]